MTEAGTMVDPPSDNRWAAIRYLNGGVLKLAIAESHRDEFDHLDDDLTGEQFFRFPLRSLDALGHGDGVFLELAGAFDAFACAVAHWQGLDNPDLASLRASLADACEGSLAERIQAVTADPEFKALTAYRNLAAHRGIVSESITMGERVEMPGRTIWLALPDSLPRDIPDRPRSPLRPILERYTVWARGALRELHDEAIRAWNLADDPNLIPNYWNLGPTSEYET